MIQPSLFPTEAAAPPEVQELAPEQLVPEENRTFGKKTVQALPTERRTKRKKTTITAAILAAAGISVFAGFASTAALLRTPQTALIEQTQETLSANEDMTTEPQPTATE